MLVRHRAHHQRFPLTGHLETAVSLVAYLLGAAVASLVAVAIALTSPSLVAKGSAGLALMISWVRYPYFLLLSWVAISPLFGSSVSFIQGNNFDTAITIPTVLLLFTMPVRRTLRSVPGFALLAAFVIWIVFGLTISPLTPINFIKSWGIYVDQVACVVLAINLLTTRDRLSRFVNVLLLVPDLLALYGMYGFLTHHAVIQTAGHARLVSIYSAAPPVALLLSNAIPLALYRSVHGTRNERILGLTSMLILVLAVLLTGTRGVILSFPIEAAAALLLLRGVRLRLAFLLACLLGAALLFSSSLPLLSRLATDNAATLNGRTQLWQVLLANFSPTAIFGHGLGAGTHFLIVAATNHSALLAGVTYIGTNPQDLYIEVLFDQGMIGLAFLMAAFLALGVQTFLGLVRETGERRTLFLAALLTLLNVLALSVEGSDLFTQAIGLEFWLIIALPFAVCWTGRAMEAPSRDDTLASKPGRLVRMPAPMAVHGGPGA